MLLRLYPPLLAALMIALAVAVPGAFWLHARNARRRALPVAPRAAYGHDRVVVPRSVTPSPVTPSPVTPSPAPPRPRPTRSPVVVPFRAGRIEERVWSPEPDPPVPPRARPRG